MSGSVNLAIMQGNLARDPEIRSLNGDRRMANFSIATSERWTDRASGEKKEKTEWVRVSVFNQNIVNVVEKYVKKGSSVYVEGKLESHDWTDNQGEKRRTTEVVLTQISGVLKLMGSPRGEQSGGDSRRQPERTDPRGNPQYGGSTGADLDDEIPFAANWQE